MNEADSRGRERGRERGRGERRRGYGVAPARAALAGNPSDGYGGAVLAVTVPGHEAQAQAAHSDGLAVEPPNRLVEAAIRRFALRHAPALNSRVAWSTSVPRGVGLGGSSAIVIATLRALADLHELRIPEAELAGTALVVETEDLGIAAGLQDRIAQAYGGLTFMDFAAGRYEPLDPALLPPLVVAWRTHAAEDSGGVHSDLRMRFEQGDAVVRDAMAELGDLARRGRDALLAGDRRTFARSVDGSFDARARMLALDRRHLEMIEIARAAGAAANYTGSGGAIVAVCDDAAQRDRVAGALADAACGLCLR